MSEISYSSDSDELYDEDNLHIEKLPFKDLYVRVDEDAYFETESRYNPTPAPSIDPYHCLVVPPQFNTNIQKLRLKLRANDRHDFAIFWNGIRMRVVRLETVSRESTDKNEEWCCMRRFSTRLPDIDTIGLQSSDIEVIRKQGRQHGLIVICGGTGAGKTTTGIATFRNYLRNPGGVGYMVEDPCEYIMQGAFDAGPEKSFILQREVKEESEWVQAIKDGLRSNPKFVYLGEVRSPSSASQMLRMANSGHLVICTVHGSSIEQGISALVQIARVEQGELGNQLLADCLRLIIYQRMTPNGPVLSLMEAGEMSDPIREHIRKGEMKMLAGQIEQQKAQSRVKADERANAMGALGNKPVSIQPRPSQVARPVSPNPVAQRPVAPSAPPPPPPPKPVAPQQVEEVKKKNWFKK